MSTPSIIIKDIEALGRLVQQVKLAALAREQAAKDADDQAAADAANALVQLCFDIEEVLVHAAIDKVDASQDLSAASSELEGLNGTLQDGIDDVKELAKSINKITKTVKAITKVIKTVLKVV